MDPLFLKVIASVVLLAVSVAMLNTGKKGTASQKKAQRIINDLGIALFKESKDIPAVKKEDIAVRKIENENANITQKKSILFTDKVWKIFDNSRIENPLRPDDNITREAKKNIDDAKAKADEKLVPLKDALDKSQRNYDSVKIKIDALALKREKIKKAVNFNINKLNEIFKKRKLDLAEVLKSEAGLDKLSKNILEETIDFSWFSFPKDKSEFEMLVIAIQKEIFLVENDIFDTNQDERLKEIRNSLNVIETLVPEFFSLEEKVEGMKNEEKTAEDAMKKAKDDFDMVYSDLSKTISENSKKIEDNSPKSIILREVEKIDKDVSEAISAS